MADSGEILNLRDLVRLARVRLDDLPGNAYGALWENEDSGLLWSNAELVSYAQAADIEVARRRPILDDSDTSICRITVTAVSGAVWPYSAKILWINQIRIDGEGIPLVKRTVAELNLDRPGWVERSSGQPMVYVESSQDRTLRLVPPPAADLVLLLDVARLPNVPLRWDHRLIDAPETPVEERMDLLAWIEHLAYLKRDSETYNRKRSDDAEKRFTLAFGSRPSSAKAQIQRAERNLRRHVRGHYF